MENTGKIPPSEESPKSKFQSRDMYLSAFLKARGLKLIDTARAGKTVSFIFEDSPERKSLENEFFYDDVNFNVNASSYNKQIQDLKSLIFRWEGAR